MEWLTENWEYVLIIILGIDKAVALSPSTWDDLIWTSVKKALVGNNIISITAENVKLNDENIEIPYPQRTIHIKNSASLTGGD